MASSSASEWVYPHLEDLDYQLLHSTNPYIHIVPAEDLRNKYGHDYLVFIKEGLKNFPIVHHKGWWYELYCDKRTNKPFLEPFHSEVHTTDIEAPVAEESADSKDKLDLEEEDELEPYDNL